MSQLPKIYRPTLARLHNDVPGLLHSADANDSTIKTRSGKDARRNNAQTVIPWPGQDIGIRAPEDWEVRLSAEEVAYLINWKTL